MHLNECVAMALAAAGAASGARLSHTDWETPYGNQTSVGDVHDCLSGWLFKSTTNFYGSEELHLPWWFGLFCLNYSVGGAVMMIVRPKWADTGSFPYTAFAFFLILFQGPLSFMADYVNMTEDSAWHVIDRFSATAMLSAELLKICAMFPHFRAGTFASYASACGLAVASWFRAQEAQSALEADVFVFWHNLWHMYPLVVSAIVVYDRYVLGEYDAAEASSGRGVSGGMIGSPKPKLLSAVIMERSVNAAPSSVRGAAEIRARISRR